MSWVLVFLGFSLLIILHEFGHFVVAKWTGMRVERFFLFFPPKLWSIKRGETEYGIGAIPLGGFVKITGMNPDEVDPPDDPDKRGEPGILEKIESVDQDAGEGVSKPGEPLPPDLRKRAYYYQPVWKRIAVISAGPVMNILIAFLVLFVLAFSAERATSLEVADIESDSPAAGLLEDGDRVVAVDGVRPASDNLSEQAKTLTQQINNHPCAGEAVDDCRSATPATIVVERNGKERTLQATPYYDADAPGLEEGEEGRYRLGFSYQATGLVPENPSAPEAAEMALDRMWEVTSGTVSVLARLFEQEQREQVSGVVGISTVGNQAVGLGATEALTLLALVSLSLAIVNLIPLLPLDGGHIFWSVVEKVRGRRVPFRVMERASAIGMLLFLFLFFIGLTNDIERLSNDEFNLNR